ncbi:MAG: hypothetical protein ACRDSK_04520 [Actinophytocola sp.]|uniref:hypothetical protein n=1 Tax=Actinophytocola sp. TaxID=1872138 RepID=UPI003D6BA4FA
MSEKQDTQSIRFSQVLSGALAAITAAVLGSTMGVAGTVIGAGLASMVTTVGGALYLRSIQRTRQGVQSVRNLVVARAGGTSVTLLEERPETAAEAKARTEEPETDEPETDSAKAETETEPATTEHAETEHAETEQAETEQSTLDQATTKLESVEEPDEESRRKLRWPALIAASVLAFMVGMLVVTGVEAIRGETLSGDKGTTVGGIVRTQQDGGQDRDQAPPATRESTTTPTDPSTVTVTENPPTSENEEPVAPPTEPTEPETTAPETTTGGEPTGTVTVPPNGQTG